MSKFRHSLVAAVLVSAGCTMIPKYKRPTAPVAAGYPGVNTTRESGAADIAWRDFFAEARLRKIIELALSNNRDLRVAILNVEQSRAQYRVTRSASFPTISGGGSFTRSYSAISTPGVTSTGITTTTIGTTADQWAASLGTTSYEVDLFGRVRSLNKQALEKYFATAEAQRSAQITLVSEVATQYFTLREAGEQLNVAQETLKAVSESYDLSKANFNAGATSELDMRTAEGELQTARIDVMTYEREVAQALNALVLLVGSGIPDRLPAPRPFGDTDLLANIPAGLPSELVLRRADILEAEHTLKAANANIGAARAAFFPTITFTGSVGVESEQLSELLGAGSGLWSFAPQISMPIFTGGLNLANLDAAKVSVRIEAANYEKAIQAAFREVADALVAINSYGRQIDAQAGLIKAQQIRYNLSFARYRLGEDSYLNVLLAQQDLYSARQSRIQTQYNKLASQISLYQALGGGWR